MPRVCHSREQDVDLSHREDTLEATPDNMLDRQRLRFVDLSLLRGDAR